jgi:DNA adenine methylase
VNGAGRQPLKAPFPWFGAKSRVAHVVWDRLGDVPNMIEPFAGSLAVLLARPHKPKIETVNDLDGLVSNFWRALKHDPEQTASYADWPVNEVDLIARQRWLMKHGLKILDKLYEDPEWFDAKIAGWWVWGQCSVSNLDWCRRTNRSNGISKSVRLISEVGINRHLSVYPHLSGDGQGINCRGTDIKKYFITLHDRIRRVRIACGEWDRVLNPNATTSLGVTGIVLDPPYSHAMRDQVYSVETDVSAKVRKWAIDNGNNKLMRIALCGYEREHDMPEGWDVFEWKAQGGFSVTGKKESRAKDNARRERIWFSPYCVRGQFDDLVKTLLSNNNGKM